jgi:hypothetical protein
MNNLQPWVNSVVHEKLKQATDSYPDVSTSNSGLNIRGGKGKWVQVIAVSTPSRLLRIAKLRAHDSSTQLLLTSITTQLYLTEQIAFEQGYMLGIPGSLLWGL